MSSSWLVRQISEKTKLRSTSSSYSLHSTSTATTSTSVASLCSSSPMGGVTGTGAMTDESSLSLEQWRKSDCSLDYWNVHLDGTGTPNSNSNHVNVKLSDSNSNGDRNGNSTGETKAMTNGDKDYLFERLIHGAPHLHVYLQSFAEGNEKCPAPAHAPELPDWIDYSKLRDGLKFIHKHFFAIIFAHAVGLFLLVTVKPIQSLLLRTSSGIHARPEKAFTFFLKVFVQLVQWYKSMKYEVLEQEHLHSKPIPGQNRRSTSTNFESELSEIKTFIELINAKFKKFIPPLKQELQLTSKEEVMLKALKAELRSASAGTSELKAVEPILVTMNPTLAFSQYHVAVIQYAFYGLVCKYPRLFGVHEKGGDGNRGLEGFRHVWAVLGHMLGLSDDFNCALQNSRDCEDKILSRVLLFSLSIIDETGLHMWRIISAGFTKYFVFMRTDVVIQFILQKLVNSQACNSNASSEEKGFWNNMSFTHKLYYLIYSFILRFLLRYSLFRITFNKLTAVMIRYANYVYRKKKRASAKRNSARARSGSIYTLSRSISSTSKGGEEVQSV